MIEGVGLLRVFRKWIYGLCGAKQSRRLAKELSTCPAVVFEAVGSTVTQPAAPSRTAGRYWFYDQSRSSGCTGFSCPRSGLALAPRWSVQEAARGHQSMVAAKVTADTRETTRPCRLSPPRPGGAQGMSNLKAR